MSCNLRTNNKNFHGVKFNLEFHGKYLIWDFGLKKIHKNCFTKINKPNEEISGGQACWLRLHLRSRQRIKIMLFSRVENKAKLKPSTNPSVKISISFGDFVQHNMLIC